MYLIGPLALGGYAGSKAHASLCIVMWLVLAWRLAAAGADLDESQRLWLSGRYADGIALAEKALRDGRNVEEWQLALSRSLLTVGRYEQALAVMTNALARNTRSIRLRWRAREAFLSNGKTGHADKMLEEIIALVALQPWAYRDAPNLLVFGQAALLQGADPKSVLEKLFETVRKSDPILRDGYIVSGELALDKHDFALAAQTFQEGLKKHPADPDLHLGLARAYKPSDRTLMLASAETALKLNTNHVPSLLLLGDHWIDAEDYAAADKLLARVLAVNPWHPEAWAYRALLARLRNKPAEEQAARESALRFWKTNPRVDHLIGLKLSQKYRFAEGASCQRQSLHLDKDYLLAKAQLATDLLRLGEEAQGWSLAEEVHAKDGYDVAAYNLVTLRQTMAKFNTITNQDFILRMNAHEAQVYSQLVLESLARAKNQLCAKYSLELEHPAIIEIFPEQKDFSVRTFGLPENPGYLGVCFGRVITMTSPAAHPGHPINWEAVLWHEFCHVVTLQLSRNRMPRWLSEGLSVYEERLANPAWGQRMSWRHRQMILQGELAPVSRLSAAFLAPRSDAHLQFAYYQSSLVVEYLMQRFGLAPLRAILQDLGQGMEINPAIEKHTAPMATIEKDFDRFARQQAEKLAPGLDWERLGIEAALGDADELWSKWAKARPNNFWALTRQAEKLIEEKRWQEAKAPLQKLIELYPANTGPDNAYRMLAMACRALDETDQERLVLGQWAERDAVATDAYLRLMELSARAKDWPAVVQNARRFIAVNPLIAPPYHYLAKAGESLGETRQAIEAYRTLLRLDPPQPVEIHFRLASLLRRVGDPAARRHVLMALEDAPRHRAALRLLLELNGEMPGEDAGPATKLEGQR